MMRQSSLTQAPSSASTVLTRSTGYQQNQDEYDLNSTAANETWVRAALQRTCLPDVGWPQVRNLIEAEVAPFVERRSATSVRDATITEMMFGSDLFHRQRISAQPNPLLLEPPFMLPDVRQSLEEQARPETLSELRKALEARTVKSSSALAEFTERVERVFGVAVHNRQHQLPGADFSDVMGQGLAQLLSQCSRDVSIARLQHLRRCRLPMSVRAYAWQTVLLDQEKLEAISAAVHEKVARERLGDPQDMTALKSKHNNMIQRMCRNMLENPQLEPYTLSPDTATRLIAVMNYHHVLDETSDATHVLLLLPLLQVFPETKPEELVTMLKVLYERVLPPKSQVRAISTRLQSYLGEKCPDMLARMQLLVQTPPPDLELPHVAAVGDYKATVESRSVLPYLDLWINAAFVGVTECDRCYFVWDQCILTGGDFLEEFGQITLPKLQIEVMGALDSGDLFKIFSDTKDVVAWDELLALT